MLSNLLSVEDSEILWLLLELGDAANVCGLPAFGEARSESGLFFPEAPRNTPSTPSFGEDGTSFGGEELGSDVAGCPNPCM